MMRFIKWVLGGVFALLLLIVAGTFIFLNVMDTQALKDLAQKKVAEATGRELVIGGDVNLGISMQPTLVVSDVTFSNADWASEEAMAEIGELSIGLAIMPLFSGVIAVDHVVLSDATIRLSKNAKGKQTGNLRLRQRRMRKQKKPLLA